MRAEQAELHRSGRAGWLRAAVLGADDGIVSTASLMIGVAAAAGFANHRPRPRGVSHEEQSEHSPYSLCMGENCTSEGKLVSDAGRRAIAVNVPLSNPPQRINGVVISDFLAPNLKKAVYPLSLLPTLESMGYRIDTDPWVARKSLDKFVEGFKVTADK